MEEQWKLVSRRIGGPTDIYNEKEQSIGQWELYDLQADRTEMNNLIDQYPEKAKEMIEAWEAWALRANVKPFPEDLSNK
jgi:hypothetical protein